MHAKNRKKAFHEPALQSAIFSISNLKSAILNLQLRCSRRDNEADFTNRLQLRLTPAATKTVKCPG
jgi:hypothetical protein